MSCRVCLLTSLLALTTSALRTPRRQCIKAAGAALLPAAATALLPAAAAVAAAPSEVEAVLANERWDPESSFTREDFRRLDESDDKDFYTEPRFVYHIDDAAVAATASFYSNLFQRSAAASGQRPPSESVDSCQEYSRDCREEESLVRYLSQFVRSREERILPAGWDRDAGCG